MNIVNTVEIDGTEYSFQDLPEEKQIEAAKKLNVTALEMIGYRKKQNEQ